MDIGEKISFYRKEKKITIDELAELSGVPKGTINKIIAGTTKAPTLDNIKAIARALGKRLDDFDDAPSAPELNSAEQVHITKYRALDAHGKEMVDLVLDKEAERVEAMMRQRENPRQLPTISIDYYRFPVSAGTGTIDTGGGEHDTLTVVSNRYTIGADYVVRVQGDSMQPRFSSGDLLLVRKTDTVDFGEIGVFSVDGRSYIKQAGCAELISLNPAYAPIPLDSAAVYPQGRVIGVLDPAWIV